MNIDLYIPTDSTTLWISGVVTWYFLAAIVMAFGCRRWGWGDEGNGVPPFALWLISPGIVGLTMIGFLTVMIVSSPIRLFNRIVGGKNWPVFGSSLKTGVPLKDKPPLPKGGSSTYIPPQAGTGFVKPNPLPSFPGYVNDCDCDSCTQARRFLEKDT